MKIRPRRFSGREAPPAPVLWMIVGGTLFASLAVWETAAVVGCDCAAGAYFVGGIVERTVGAAAPWYILAAALLAYAARHVFVESGPLFVERGMYRAMQGAVGGLTGRVAVAAWLLAYLLAGPVAATAAGHYLMGWGCDSLALVRPSFHFPDAYRTSIQDGGATLLACLLVLYFLRQELLGIGDTRGRMVTLITVAAIVAGLLLAWSAATLALRGPANGIPFVPALPTLATRSLLRHPADALGMAGGLGLVLALGHALVVLGGGKTLAHAYREIEPPQIEHFRQAAWAGLLAGLGFTVAVAVLCVLLIPDATRVGEYGNHLLGGLAVHVAGPAWLRLALAGGVVVVGIVLLSRAVGESLRGARGLLQRAVQDGLLPEAVARPHGRYGTAYRLLYPLAGVQVLAILAAHGNVPRLGTLYAFGLVWGMLLWTLATIGLRFTDRGTRAFRMPGNVHVGGVELPLGLGAVALILLVCGVGNCVTEPRAALCGLAWLSGMAACFTACRWWFPRSDPGESGGMPARLATGAAGGAALGVEDKPYRKLVAIRAATNLHMLDRALAETDLATTEVVVLAARLQPPFGGLEPEFDEYDQELLAGICERVDRACAAVRILVAPSNQPMYAVVCVASRLQVSEVVLGASHQFRLDEQLQHVAAFWHELHEGAPPPLTVRVLGPHTDVYFDLGGGNRIPNLSQRPARSVSELRMAGVGVSRALLLHDDSPESSALLKSLLTMLDPAVELILLAHRAADAAPPATAWLAQDVERARELRRPVRVVEFPGGDLAQGIAAQAQAEHCDVILVGLPGAEAAAFDVGRLAELAPCRVHLVPLTSPAGD